MAVTISTNMNLPIPSVGSQPGPIYAENVNSSLTLIDAHDHTPGKGVQLGSDSLNIATALTLNNNFLEDVAGVTLIAQGSIPANGTVYRSGVDLYYVDGLGNNIQITQNGGIGGAPGSISNLTPPASASYISGSSKFVWQSNANIAADMDFGAAIMRNLSPNSTFALTLQPPAGLSTNYSITLPTLPVATSFMTISSSGIITNTIPIVQGITNSNIATDAITNDKVLNATLTSSKTVTEFFEWDSQSFTPTAATFAVRVATTVAGTFASSFDNGSVVDGITLATNDIILIKNQTNASENGVWIVPASGAPTVRHPDYDTVAELNNSARVTVTEGSVNKNSTWYQMNVLTNISDDQLWGQSMLVQYTVPTGVNMIVAELLAGGGGGGSSGPVLGTGITGSGGGGGGAGGQYIIQTIPVTPGEVLNLWVGAGGAGGNGGLGIRNSGQTGGASRIYNATNNYIAYGGAYGGAGSLSGLTSGLDGQYYVTTGGTGGPADGNNNNGGRGGGGGGGVYGGNTMYTATPIDSFGGDGGFRTAAPDRPGKPGAAGGGGGGGFGGDTGIAAAAGGEGGSNVNFPDSVPGTGGSPNLTPLRGAGGGGGGASMGNGGNGGNGSGTGNAGSPGTLGGGGGGGGGGTTASSPSTSGGKGGDGFINIYYQQGA